MIHRYKIRNNVVNYDNTGSTIPPPFTNFLVIEGKEVTETLGMPKRDHIIGNPTDNFIKINRVGFISDGDTINNDFNYKNITIPITLKSIPTDNSELIDKWVYMETRKRINPINDGERIRYRNYPGVTLKFRFYDINTNQFDDANLTNGYYNAGFLGEEINKKNNFKKSFFRLYFYDRGDELTRNLLLTEDFDTFGTLKPEFTLNRLYWLRDDDDFIGSSADKTFYMEGRFFNAKTGRVHRFINIPTTVNIPPSITQYANNPDWNTSPIKIKNPNINFGKYEFEPIIGVGNNTLSSITMTEYVLQS